MTLTKLYHHTLYSSVPHLKTADKNNGCVLEGTDVLIDEKCFETESPLWGIHYIGINVLGNNLHLRIFIVVLLLCQHKISI